MANLTEVARICRLSFANKVTHCIAGVSVSSQRNAATYNPSVVPRGRGGRSSFSGMSVGVFGASGFLGRYIVNRLGKQGTQIVIPHRCDPYYVLHMKLMADLGQIHFREFTVQEPEKIREIVKHCNVVINLLGQDYETSNFKFEDIHIKTAQMLARICKEENVARLIHVSALSADMASPSKFLRTKAAGEAVVKREFPEAIVIRPAQIYGSEDRYFNHFANQRFFGGVPLYPSAWKTVKRPVFVTDVAEGIVLACKDKTADGKTFEFYGPKPYLLSDVIEYIYRITRRPYIKYPVPRPILRLAARGFELYPFTPWLTRDMLELQHSSENPTDGLPGLEDLGIKPKIMEENAIVGLRRHRGDISYHIGIDDIEPVPVAKV
ncbi:NADH dehydrogenase [ubiquinone] 1 alpha subcomplex subunit 9, mitochondrial-like [Anneissia japonica]|uniref:NADH dehydrogenase [ubiquinone] 1 alpha subcomplex subunit 9, mitochondrial-like n=1 Tax=Anneissia japonica TaxID=1529436 RepID=UPI0014259CC3|nr:NADH dehydrogenase [ubiquinone] 1 alpha subcomplex subunit 9, mitochondrial-like [Anneissia japonica]